MQRAFHAYRGALSAIVIGFFWGATGSIFINDNVVEYRFIEGESMAPTLSPKYKETGGGDWILLRKWNATKNLQRGDLVHFMNPHKPEALAVKRVIALEGDIVLLDPKRRPSAKDGREPVAARAWDEWKGRAEVPQGHVWVEGDDWRKSNDSNWYGPISKSLIEGRALTMLRPLDKLGTKPWEEFKSRTKVLEGHGMKDWTEGLPVALAEIREPHMPP